MQYINSQTLAMNLSRLQSEVSNGTYIFKSPLTIISWETQHKYVYASCQHCLKGVQPDGNGYCCHVHQWQHVPVYRFALRVLLSDWGAEVWGVIFLLRGARVMVTIKKRIKDTYVNCTVSELKVVGS